MSDYERYTGKLRCVGFDMSKEDVEKYCHNFYKDNYENTDELPKFCIDWFDACNDKAYNYDEQNSFVYDKHKRLWLVVKVERSEMRDYYCDIRHVDDEPLEVNFDTTYYNGGTCWEEMVTDELNEIKNFRHE